MPSAKPFLHPLKTPKSATFPSELKSEHSNDTLSSGSDPVKHEEGMSTPITPPTAYTDFLKALTPVFSPVSAGVNFPKYPLEKPASNSSSTPTSQPASAVSGSFNFNEPVKSATAALPPPTSGAARPARKDPSSLRRLRIPSSTQFSPIDSPRSATTIRSPYSPADWKLRYLDTPRSATTARSISVRQVVTQTVTYKRTQLEAPPKGKRRKYHESKDS